MKKINKIQKAVVIDVPNKRSGMHMIFPFKYYYTGEVSKVLLEGDTKKQVKKIIIIYED